MDRIFKIKFETNLLCLSENKKDFEEYSFLTYPKGSCFITVDEFNITTKKFCKITNWALPDSNFLSEDSREYIDAIHTINRTMCSWANQLDDYENNFTNKGIDSFIEGYRIISVANEIKFPVSKFYWISKSDYKQCEHIVE